MLAFTPDEVAAIARQPRPWAEPSERVCPACGSTSIRFYLQGSMRNDHQILFSYVWCSRCRRYHGSTGPVPDGLVFEDPLASDALEWGAKGDTFFARLDDAWGRGVLPQRFTSIPR